MSQMPRAIITHDIAVHNHLYNWLRSQEERRDFYQLLRIASYSVSQSQRYRDWSEPKITRLLQDKEPEQFVPALTTSQVKSP